MADLSTTPPLTRASVQAAHALIAPHVHRTPVVTSQALTLLASTPRADLAGTRFADRAATPARPKLRLWFKCENLQRVGAFKARGAFHAVARLLSDDEEHGLPAHIVMPSVSAPAKVAATRGYGAHVVFSGSTAAEREVVAAEVVAATGARLVPPYDHPDIILGQGTMALELQEQVAEMMAPSKNPYRRVGGKTKTKTKTTLDAVMTPCGGGGMLAGVALACEGTGVRVFGAEPSFQGADDARRGFAAGARITEVSSRTVADGLRTPLGAHNWGVIYGRRLVKALYSVTEGEILAAMRLVFERMKMVVEPSACVPLAVALFDEDFRAMVEREAGEEGWDLGIVLSGGNVGTDALVKLFGDKEGMET
ncbi:Pyridoxal phosphate-dependent enzyme, beta subunit [Cordyceps fumosorosea ARSEF 2679]|uniref:Pyridoxal phosphate-dependent enzyme, beta subunit n=1 Tax=Cordyceps fumosorosea (strain ARSEF 2679) TaxID=1081104 RepID=A0A167NC27_CORFA|nr:Pyridoxal phosphate-dependent enzyme, beta subunit [Cordyceps fumosorosea ARSEF 2679]OAA55378.1 Pyridoxal phosphate-dependent enzyme, beta subunit [Cordyceps fumosorosea ARSEF 2679]